MDLRAKLGQPGFWVRVHATAAVTWALLIIPSVLWWSESLLWVIAMSCYANFAGSMASLQSARADCNSPTTEDIARLERLIENGRTAQTVAMLSLQREVDRLLDRD